MKDSLTQCDIEYSASSCAGHPERGSRKADAEDIECHATQGPRLNPWQAQMAKDLMEASPHGRVPVRELALACHLSAGHFARAFKRTMGKTPYAWHIESRLAHAKQLLLDPTQRVSRIAVECGFSHRAAFYRAFLRHVGVSPRQWRASNTTKESSKIVLDKPFSIPTGPEGRERRTRPGSL